MIGKLPPGALAEFVLGRAGAADERVLQGPAYGEDTGAVELGDEVLVFNPDPISLAVERIGSLGVDVACNDVAASGGDPEWLTSVVFLHDDSDAVVDEITRQLDEAARRAGVAIVAGHTEYSPGREAPLLVLNCVGLADRYVPTGGAEPGDDVILTKQAAVEGTAILATDFRDLVAPAVDAAVLDRAATFYDDVSVIDDAAAVREFAHAMHDPTEGGLVDGLLEMAVASGVAMDVDPDAIPVADETRRLAAAADVDPLRIFGSGALVAAVPGEATDDALAALEAAGVRATAIGTVHETDEPLLRLGETTYREAVRDDMYALWE